MKKNQPLYADLSKLSELERIDIAGTYAVQNPGKRVAIITEDEPEKIARYLAKLAMRFPTVTLKVSHGVPLKKAATIYIEKETDKATGAATDVCSRNIFPSQN